MKSKKQIEAKIKLGLPLTAKEKALYVLFSKKLDLGVISNGKDKN